MMLTAFSMARPRPNVCTVRSSLSSRSAATVGGCSRHGIAYSSSSTPPFSAYCHSSSIHYKYVTVSSACSLACLLADSIVALPYRSKRIPVAIQSFSPPPCLPSRYNDVHSLLISFVVFFFFSFHCSMLSSTADAMQQQQQSQEQKQLQQQEYPQEQLWQWLQELPPKHQQ